MTTRARDRWISLGVVITTVGVMVYLDSIVLAYILYIIGGLVLMAAPFDRKRVRSRWARSLLAASGVLLVLEGSVQLLGYYHVWTPSPALQRGLPHTLDLMAGVVLGFLLAVNFSGDLSGRKRSEDAPSI
jgi:hypothetical protein